MSQTTYNVNFTRAIAGTFQGEGSVRTKTVRNIATAIPQRVTLTPSAAGTVAATYTVVVTLPTGTESISTSFTGAHTVAQITSALAQEWNRKDALYQLAQAIPSATAVTATARGANTTGVYTNIINAIATSQTGGSSVATASTSAASASEIPYGVFVGRNAGDDKTGMRLPNSTDTIILGAVYGDKIRESVGRFEAARMVVPPGRSMDVVDNVNNATGMWLRCAVSSVDQDTDTVHVVVSGDTAGFVTNSNSGTKSLAGKAAFASGVETDVNGNRVVLVDFQLRP